MIVVVGSFTVEPQDREAFIASREEAMRTSRGEAGCLEYTFAADPIDPARVVLVERWESQATLDAHLAALRLRATERSGGTAPPVSPFSASIVLYTVAEERTLV